MKISTQTRYALRFLLELSLAEKNTRVTTHAIAKSQNLSEKYLEAIATKLRKAGIITSILGGGVGGGAVMAIVSASVTRWPWMNLADFPVSLIALEIFLPPP